MTTGLGNNTRKLVNFLLSTNEGAQSSLGELLGTLVLGVLDQFHDTTLVGGKASNFTDDVADESSALAENLITQEKNVN